MRLLAQASLSPVTTVLRVGDGQQTPGGMPHPSQRAPLRYYQERQGGALSLHTPFWTSTQHPDWTKAEELPREKETLIFDNMAFEQLCKEALAVGKVRDVTLPCIRFSFAQKWSIESEPFNTKLVTARIEPTRATEMVRIINPDVESVSLKDSHTTDHFHFSR